MPSALAAAWTLENSTIPGCEIFGAGEGNRTLVVSLEGFCSTIELHPLVAPSNAIWRSEPSTARDVDAMGSHPLGSDSHDEPGRYRCKLDRSPLVASIDLCGAMARLID